MNVLVTGGAGFIGSALVRELLRRPDHRVTVLDKLTYAGSESNLAGLGIEFVRGDVARPEDVRAVLEREKGVDRICHLAAETHVDRSLADPAPFLSTNVVGTQVLLDEARRAGVGRFVHVSTDEVYGSVAPEGSCGEEAPFHPSSPYAASKAAAEHMVGAARTSWGLSAVIARPSNNYGPRQHPEKAVPLFATRALAGGELPLYGDGLHERDWLHVEDCARALALLVEAGPTGSAAYNISYGHPRPNLEVAQSIIRLAGTAGAAVRHVEDRPGHDRRYAPDSSRFRAEFGWRPLVDFEDGLRRTVEWYRR